MTDKDVAVEANLDGIVAPYHNYAGLSYGNVASETHSQSASNPREAALQGLRKMKFMHDMGLPQLVMPPQVRPLPRVMHALGFQSLDNVPDAFLPALYSASSMWVANAATISPSADTSDGRVHITPANLISKFHRSVEAPVTASYLRQIFRGPAFVHHDPLPAHPLFADEGAANHMRLGKNYGERGVEIFVYGGETNRYPARQSRNACEALIRLHGLAPGHAVILEQTSRAIDAGVFHNDVIAMSNAGLLIYHEHAYTLAMPGDERFSAVMISETDLPLPVAISSYFFNSQIVSVPDGGVVVVAPRECEEHSLSKSCFDRLIDQGVITDVYYLDVRESMKNGGGPACLRLRIVLNDAQCRQVHNSAWLSDINYPLLCKWIESHYRDKLASKDLRDPALFKESAIALEALQTILQMDLAAA